MANPNIVNVSDIRGKTFFNALTTSYTTLISNAASSNSVYKVNVISVSNATGGTRTVSAAVYRSGVYYDIAQDVEVPNSSTLVITSKDTSFYLEEDDVLTAKSNSSGCEVMVSYEIIS